MTESSRPAAAFEPLPPPTTVGDLFARQPIRWGLRGDVYLWLELQQTLAHVPVPKNRWELERILRESWQAAMGLALTDSATPVYVERFDPGRGLSAGNVLPSWWHHTGMMILVDRFCAFTGEW